MEVFKIVLLTYLIVQTISFFVLMAITDRVQKYGVSNLDKFQKDCLRFVTPIPYYICICISISVKYIIFLIKYIFGYKAFYIIGKDIKGKKKVCYILVRSIYSKNVASKKYIKTTSSLKHPIFLKDLKKLYEIGKSYKFKHFIAAFGGY